MQKNIDANLKEYYSKRAREYDKIYHRDIPIRLKEQNMIATEIKKIFKGKYVLELACGTGYWTKYLVGSAEKVLATDINQEMLKIASCRIPDKSVQFLIGDAYDPPSSIPQFTGAIANFWISHIPKNRISQFLSALHNILPPNSMIMFVDGVHREELGGKLIRKKGSADTWKRRKLENNEEYDIVKNYYTKKELLGLFAPHTTKVSVKYLTHFWIVTYKLTKRGILSKQQMIK